MLPDADAAYLALKSRDARFDGRLFVGVTSTGVYCRPVCRVRTPRFENCRFFEHPALAEAARFRPCLKCRPELAPGLSLADAAQTLAAAAAQALVRAVHLGQPTSLPAVAAQLGVTDRHLRRIFQAEQGVSPIEFLTTQRLLLAKQLLTDTALPVTEVALACGYGSLRRFHAAFAERYRLNPGALRREADTAERSTAAARGAERPAGLRLGYRPPYDLDGMLGFLQRRTIDGVEQVDGRSWRRTWAWDDGTRVRRGWFEARFEPERHEVRLIVSPDLAPVLPVLRMGLRRALDLDADPQAIDPVLARRPAPAAEVQAGEPAPGDLAAPTPIALPAFAAGLRLPGALDGFELAVRVILGQQVTVKAARTLLARVVERYGDPLDTGEPALRRLFPTPQAIAEADPETLGRLGIVRQRVRALQAVAQALRAGRLQLAPGAPLESTLEQLRALPGIGEWTAQLIALRALGWPDAFPATDIGVQIALGTRDARRAQALADIWRPWRGYAVMALWHTLETAR